MSSLLEIPKQIALKGEKVIAEYERLYFIERGLENEICDLEEEVDELEVKIRDWYDPDYVEKIRSNHSWRMPYFHKRNEQESSVKRAWVLKGLSDQYTNLVLKIGDRMTEREQVQSEMYELGR